MAHNIYYHNDMDGKCSAAIAISHMMANGILKSDINAFPVDYDIPFPLGKTGEGDHVYVLDFTPAKLVFSKLISKAQSVTWIDHHKVIETLADDQFKVLAGNRNRTNCAAVLAWQYFVGGMNIPRFLSYVNAWDLHIKSDENLFRDAERINAYVQYHGLHTPWSELWGEMMLAQQGTLNRKLEKILPIGKVIIETKSAISRQLLPSALRIIDFEDHKAAVFNLPIKLIDANSIQTIEGADICAFYHVTNHDNWRVELRTLDHKTDVGEIATKYGGGGHNSAAGFITHKLPEAFIKFENEGENHGNGKKEKGPGEEKTG